MCTVDGDTITWNDIGANRYTVRQVTNGDDTFLDDVGTDLSLDLNVEREAFIIRAFFGNEVSVDSEPCNGNL